MILNCFVLHCGYMSSNSRWFLDTVLNSFSFKAEHEISCFTITLEPRFRHLGGTVKNMCLNGDVLKSKNETRMQQNVLYTQLVFSEICSKFRLF